MAATVAAMTSPPSTPIAATSATGWWGCHSGGATAVKAPRPTAQAAAVIGIHRHARRTWCRSSVHCAKPIVVRSTTAATPASG